jgi:hypothetical protein
LVVAIGECLLAAVSDDLVVVTKAAQLATKLRLAFVLWDQVPL